MRYACNLVGSGLGHTARPVLTRITPLPVEQEMSELSVLSKSTQFPVLAGDADSQLRRLLQVATQLYKQVVASGAREAGWAWEGGFVRSDSALAADEATGHHAGTVWTPLALIKMNLTATGFQPGV